MLRGSKLNQAIAWPCCIVFGILAAVKRQLALELNSAVLYEGTLIHDKEEEYYTNEEELLPPSSSVQTSAVVSHKYRSEELLLRSSSSMSVRCMKDEMIVLLSLNFI